MATRQAAATVVQVGVKAATAYGRPDLAQRLGRVAQRLSESAFHVLVVGEFKQGKSSLINALLNAPLCPVDDDVATAVPTMVGWAPEPRAAALFAPAAEGAPPEKQEIALAEVATYASEAGNPDNERNLQAVEVGFPRDLLRQGLVLVDTPGVGGLGSAHSAITVGALPMADALLFVSDASQEFSEPEIGFLVNAVQLCPNVACLLTKIDFYPEWRTIVALDAKHLHAARVRAPILLLSSRMRHQALQTRDAELDRESGFPVLLEHLRDVVAHGHELAVRAAAAAVISAADQLAISFESERQALADPRRAEVVLNRLRLARDQAERLRSQSARWQQTLGDGIADLSADVDHDLRTRARDILREADEAIDASDPADVWEEFEAWVYRRAIQDVTENYTLLQRRSAELNERVSEHFDLGSGEVSQALIDPADPSHALASVKADASVSMQRLGVGAQGLAALRGGYGGTAMFGMLGQMVGMTMLNPLILGVGLFMGRKALRDEKERQLSQRRLQAKNAVRRYVDEVSFTLGKDSRDALRRIQRQLRDWFTQQAEELHRSTTEALLAAQQAATSEAGERKQRLADVEAELRRLSGLRDQALQLAPELVSR